MIEGALKAKAKLDSISMLKLSVKKAYELSMEYFKIKAKKKDLKTIIIVF